MNLNFKLKITEDTLIVKEIPFECIDGSFLNYNAYIAVLPIMKADYIKFIKEHFEDKEETTTMDIEVELKEDITSIYRFEENGITGKRKAHFSLLMGLSLIEFPKVSSMIQKRYKG